MKLNNLKDLNLHDLTIISKYFDSLNDFINIIKVSKQYLQIPLQFHYNPFDLPFNNTNEMKVIQELFKNINEIHYYSPQDFPHFLNKSIIHFTVKYKPELDKYFDYCEFEKLVLLRDDLIDNLNPEVIKRITNIKHSDIPCGLSNVDLSPFTKLTKLGYTSFSFETIKSIRLPASLIEIGGSCFYYSNDLTNIDLSKCTNLTKINYSAFEESDLKKIVFPTSLVKIGDECFKDCELEEVDLSKCTNLTKIGKDALNSTDFNLIKLPTSITKLTRSFDSPNDFIIPDHILELDVNCLSYTMCDKIVFPPLIEIIPESCCYDSNIGRIDLSKCKNLKEIDDMAFAKCYNLAEIELPNTITRLGKIVFAYNLKNVNILLDIIEIDDECFERCKLKEVDLRECKNLKRLGKKCFNKDTKIIIDEDLKNKIEINGEIEIESQS